MEKLSNKLRDKYNDYYEKILFYFVIMVFGTLTLSVQHSFSTRNIHNYLLILAWLFLLLSALFSCLIIKNKLDSYWSNLKYSIYQDSIKYNIENTNKQIVDHQKQINEAMKNIRENIKDANLQAQFMPPLIQGLQENQRLQEEYKPFFENEMKQWERSEKDSSEAMNRLSIIISKRIKLMLLFYIASVILLFLYHSINLYK